MPDQERFDQLMASEDAGKMLQWAIELDIQAAQLRSRARELIEIGGLHPVHPWYGQCDSFGSYGPGAHQKYCTECARVVSELKRSLSDPCHVVPAEIDQKNE